MTRSILFASALALSALPATAQDTPQVTERPSVWSFLTAEYLTTALAHSAINWARFLADIRYDQLSVDPVAMRVVLTGVDIAPLIPDLPDGACRITAERMTLNGVPMDRIATGRGRVAIDGMGFAAGCLPPEGATMLRALGFPTIESSFTEIEFDYDYASGGGTLRISSDLERLVSLNLKADLDYISFRMDFETEEPVVAVDLTHAELSLRDRGGWALARNFLPADLQAPGALGPVVQGGLTQMFAEANGPEVAPTDAQRAFALQAGQLIGALGDGGQLVVSTAITAPPVRISEDSVQPFARLYDRLAPVMGVQAPAVLTALPVDQLQIAIDATDPPADAFETGRALITGIGAPRNTNLGVRLLVPLARNGNAEASLLIAETIETTHPGDAYGHALRAATANLPGALALLDRIERTLPYDQVIEEQNALMHGPEALYDDLDAMRTAARQFLTGTDRPRSWRAAYYWASMAAAAGDASGAAIRDEINETLRLRGDGAVWLTEAETLENGVLRDWIAKDVPTLLR